jgi:hypothetical protein
VPTSANLFNPVSSLSALRDVLQRLLRFVNQRQRSFPERVR